MSKPSQTQIVSTVRNRGHGLERHKRSDMTWLALESKMFTAVAYDAARQTLYLRFQSGDVYRYFDFSSDDYQQFLNAESKGRHFLSTIRNCFSYERMAKLQLA